jgi:hypothetical protein
MHVAHSMQDTHICRTLHVAHTSHCMQHKAFSAQHAAHTPHRMHPRTRLSSCVAAFCLSSLCCQFACRTDCLSGVLGVVVCVGFDSASRTCFDYVCTPALIPVGDLVPLVLTLPLCFGLCKPLLVGVHILCPRSVGTSRIL